MGRGRGSRVVLISLVDVSVAYVFVGLFVAALGSCLVLPAGYSFLDVASGLHELPLCHSPFRLGSLPSRCMLVVTLQYCLWPLLTGGLYLFNRPAWQLCTDVSLGLACSPHPRSSSSGPMICKFQRNMPQPELGEKRLTLEHHILPLPDSLWKGKISLHTYTNGGGGGYVMHTHGDCLVVSIKC